MKRNKFSRKNVVILTALSTANASFDAPESTGQSTSVAGAVTLNADAGVITTEPLATLAGGVATITLTNSKILTTSRFDFSLEYPAAGTGIPVPSSFTINPLGGAVIIRILNAAPLLALDSAVKIHFSVGQRLVKV